MATFAGLATNTVTTAVNNAGAVNGGDIVNVVMAETEEGVAIVEEKKQDEVSVSSRGNSAILEEGDGHQTSAVNACYVIL